MFAVCSSPTKFDNLLLDICKFLRPLYAILATDGFDLEKLLNNV